MLPLVPTEDVETPAGPAELLGTVRSHEDTGAHGAAAPAMFRRRAAADVPPAATDVGRDPAAPTAIPPQPPARPPRSRIPLLTASPDAPGADRTTRPTSV
ncbi:hypothetical protein [Streptomyces sp. NPDC001100]